MRSGKHAATRARSERGSIGGVVLPFQRDRGRDGRIDEAAERVTGRAVLVTAPEAATPTATPATTATVPRPARLSRLRLRESHGLLSAELAILVPLALLSDLAIALVAVAYVVAAAVWRKKDLYTRRFSLSLLDDLAALIVGAGAATAPVVVLGVGAMGAGLTPALVAVTVVFGAAVIARACAYAVIVGARRRGLISYPTVVVGAGRSALDLVRRIKEHPESGLRTVGVLDGDAASDLPVPLLGDANELADVVAAHEVTDVVIGFGRMPTSDLVQVLRACDRLDVEIHVLPRLFEMHRMAVGCDQVWGVPLMRVRRLAHRSLSWRFKRVLDVTVSGLALLLLSPLLLVTGIAVRRELGPGVLFDQVRVGLDGRSFTIRKFRSMRPVADGSESPWSVTGDDRIGPVGRFIRRYSIDELPQLLNVLRGDMSLVGPRPERPEYVERFRAQFPRYADRHRVPVGLTGLAAVQGLRGDTSISERAHFDNLYIENWSLWLDLRIIARTVLSVVRGAGG